jgi:beta-glucosidase
VDKADLGDYLTARAQDWNRAFLEMAVTRFGGHSLQTYYYRLINYIYSKLSDASHFHTAIDAVYDSPRKQLFDYLGLDIYDPFTGAYLIKLPTPRRIKEKEPVLRVALWENVYEPSEFGQVIRAHARDSGDIPIYIMESGMCHRQKKGGHPHRRFDDLTRDVFLKGMLGEMVKGIREGLPLKGYFFWSLTDNYEWGSYEPRFGLHEYDFEAGKILDKDGLGTAAGKAYAELIAALRSGDPEKMQEAFS